MMIKHGICNTDMNNNITNVGSNGIQMVRAGSNGINVDVDSNVTFNVDSNGINVGAILITKRSRNLLDFSRKFASCMRNQHNDCFIAVQNCIFLCLCLDIC
eukprot:489525_1